MLAYVEDKGCGLPAPEAASSGAELRAVKDAAAAEAAELRSELQHLRSFSPNLIFGLNRE